MHWIDEATVESAWRDIAAYDGDRAQNEMMALGTNQPELLAFVMAACDDIRDEARELAVYMFFVLYRIFEQAYRQPLPHLSMDAILAQEQATEQLMESLAEVDDEKMSLVGMQEMQRQPWVTQYVVEALMEEPDSDDPVNLSEEEHGQIFLVLKTVIDALDAATDEA